MGETLFTWISRFPSLRWAEPDATVGPCRGSEALALSAGISSILQPRPVPEPSFVSGRNITKSGRPRRRNSMPIKSRNSNNRPVGQLLIIGFDAVEVSPGLSSLLQQVQPAGVILFARNIKTP